MAMSGPECSTNNSHNRTFRVFLFEIACEITNELLDSLKYLCQDDFHMGELGSINTSREFLELLWKGDKIWPGDVTYLVKLLETAGNVKLANKVREEEPEHKRSNLPRQTCHFIGRDAIVNEIMKKMLSGPVHMVILIALPGMGKTEVAIRVGHLLQSEKWPVLFVERKESFLEVCEEILYRLTNRHWTICDNIVSHAKRKLSELKDDIVIILDNTESVQGAAFDDFVKFLVKSAPKARVIITTQQDIGFAAAGDVHKIRLDPLNPSSSAELLTQLAPNAKNYAREVGELCGGIPLFLKCACSLMYDGFNPRVFTKELRENPSRVLKGEHLEAFYQSMGRFFLHKFPEHVLRNLVTLSVFPSSFSTDDIKFLFDDEFQLETVKTKLTQCCLLQLINDELLMIHPLIQTYCREERESLNLEDVGRAAELKFNHHYLEVLRGLHKEFIAKDSSSVAILSFRKNKANIMEALKNCLDATSEAEEKAFAIDVANEVVDFLAKILSPPMECTKLYQKCCEIARHSADPERLADSLNSCGFRRLDDLAHGKADDATLQMFQEAYEIRKRLPEEVQKCEKHAHTTTTKLGLCFLLQGEVEKGRQLIHEGIALRKELGVPLYVAAGNCDLGHSHRHCGEYQKAVQIWQTETLPIYKEHLGDHPWTASILQHIAFAFMEIARETPTHYADQAEKYTKEALELRERLLEVHQDTARSHIHLSLVYTIQEKLNSALRELEKALEIQEDVVGVQQDTVDTLDMMTKVLTRLRRQEEAEKMTERMRHYRKTLEAGSK